MSEPIKNALPTASSILDQVLNVIYSAISELNIQLPEGGRIEKSPSTVLMGAGGKLDSLALANFIVIAEQKLEESLGFPIDLTQEDPFSPGTGYFQSVQSLANHISRFVQEKV